MVLVWRKSLRGHVHQYSLTLMINRYLFRRWFRDQYSGLYIELKFERRSYQANQVI
jgi:hypothetical protein